MIEIEKPTDVEICGFFVGTPSGASQLCSKAAVLRLLYSRLEPLAVKRFTESFCNARALSGSSPFRFGK